MEAEAIEKNINTAKQLRHEKRSQGVKDEVEG